MAGYCVTIMTNRSGTLYVGVTDDPAKHVYELKYKVMEGFTARYNLYRLMYYESTPSIVSAIDREKQIKGWLRKRKIALIASLNPRWENLSAEWGSSETGIKPVTESEILRSSACGGLSQNDKMMSAYLLNDPEAVASMARPSGWGLVSSRRIPRRKWDRLHVGGTVKCLPERRGQQ